MKNVLALAVVAALFGSVVPTQFNFFAVARADDKKDGGTTPPPPKKEKGSDRVEDPCKEGGRACPGSY